MLILKAENEFFLKKFDECQKSCKTIKIKVEMYDKIVKYLQLNILIKGQRDNL